MSPTGAATIITASVFTTRLGNQTTNEMNRGTMSNMLSIQQPLSSEHWVHQHTAEGNVTTTHKPQVLESLWPDVRRDLVTGSPVNYYNFILRTDFMTIDSIFAEIFDPEPQTATSWQLWWKRSPAHSDFILGEIFLPDFRGNPSNQWWRFSVWLTDWYYVFKHVIQAASDSYKVLLMGRMWFEALRSLRETPLSNTE